MQWQKALFLWLKEDGADSIFFHGVMSSRRRLGNFITGFKLMAKELKFK